MVTVLVGQTAQIVGHYVDFLQICMVTYGEKVS